MLRGLSAAKMCPIVTSVDEGVAGPTVNRERSQVLEVPGYRQVDASGLLIRAARGGMSGVSSRLDRRHRHPGVFEPVECELGQGGPDATALVIGIDSQHGDLAHASLGMMKLDRHEADDARTYLGDPHSPLFCIADVLYLPPLIFSPVWMLSPENLGTQRLLKRHEDRRPRPQREVNYRLGFSIVKWPNPWLNRFTS